MKAPARQWMFAPQTSADQVEPLCREFDLHPMVSSLLVRRGIASESQAHHFLQPSLKHLRDPHQLEDLSQAVLQVIQAIKQNRHILVLGDYDVDGVTATAMLMEFLSACGHQALSYFVPNRFEHGYGLTQEAVEAILPRRPDLVITVDNGTVAASEVDYLHQQGVEVIITDHHQAPSHRMPDCLTVNPNKAGSAYPFKGISGCGVALKLVMGLRKALREEGWFNERLREPNLLQYLDLAALGTIADVVPLLDENRILVHHGLHVLNQESRVGVQAIKAIRNLKQIDSRTVAFQIAPLLNSAGRMGEASRAVELLLCQNPAQARQLAQELLNENDYRRQTEQSMVQEALRHSALFEQQSGVFCASENFHEGIIGIVAARLCERFHKPALVLAKNGQGYKGSARSIPDVDISRVFADCKDVLKRYGGHCAAAGCVVEEEHLEAFRQGYLQSCQQHNPHGAQPQLMLEAHLEPNRIDPELVQQVLRLQPFGQANPEPLFCLQRPMEQYRVLKDKHVKWVMGADQEMLGWNLAEPFEQALPDRLAVTLGFNEFRGVRKIQYLIQEYQ